MLRFSLPVTPKTCALSVAIRVDCWLLPRSRRNFKLGCIDHDVLLLLSGPPSKRKKGSEEPDFDKESQKYGVIPSVSTQLLLQNDRQLPRAEQQQCYVSKWLKSKLDEQHIPGWFYLFQYSGAGRVKWQ